MGTPKQRKKHLIHITVFLLYSKQMLKFNDFMDRRIPHSGCKKVPIFNYLCAYHAITDLFIIYEQIVIPFAAFLQ